MDFPEAPFTGDRVSTLFDVATGTSGFPLIIGPGWVSETLGVAMGMPVEAERYFVASLYASRPDESDIVDPEVHTTWFWQVRPLNPEQGRMSVFGGGLSFGTVQMGWVWNYESEPPTPRFDFLLDEGGAVGRGAHGMVALGPYTPQKRAVLAPLSFETRARQGTKLEISAEQPMLRVCAYAEREFSAETGETRSVELALGGRVVARLEGGGEILADFGIGSATADDPAPLADGGQLSLRALPPEQGWALILQAVENRARLRGRAAEVEVVDAVELGKLLPPQPFSNAPPADIMALNFGPIDVGEDRTVELVAHLPAGRIRAFRAQGRLMSVPLGLADTDDADVFLRAEGRDPLPEPVLCLDGCPLPDVEDVRLVLQGHIQLDGPQEGSPPFGDVPTRTGLNVPLDHTVLKVRRARDLLALDFRFGGVRVASTGEGGSLQFQAVEPAPSDFARPAGPRAAVMVAEFPAQHVAEEAFFRRENFGIGLPRVDYLELVAGRLGKDGDLDGVRKQLEKLRRGTRRDKIDARVALRDTLVVVETKMLDGKEEEELSPEERSDLTAIRNVLNASPKSPREGRLPADQTVFIGEDDADPDVLSGMWEDLHDDLLVENIRLLISRLLSVEADVPDEALTNRIKAMLGGLSSGKDLVVEPDVSVRRYFIREKISPSLASAQSDASELKAAVAADYAVFREFWGDFVEDRAAELAPATLQRARGIVSVRIAAESNDAEVRALFVEALVEYSDPTGSASEPFPARARARFSEPSRLAFAWKIEGGRQDFSLAALLQRMGGQGVVTRRAEVLRVADADGVVVRQTDPAAILAHQGIAPSPTAQGATLKRMSEVWTAASRAPTEYETSIELPFRLNLSPAQDAVWVQRHPVPDEVFEPIENDAPPETDEGELLWSISLAPDTPNPLLRAVWSEDFRPESFLQAFRHEFSTSEELNTLYDQAPRGRIAPWQLERVVRRDGEIVEVRPVEGDQTPVRMRTSLDAYDRDQLVKQSSVPGLPNEGKIDPVTQEVRKDAGALLPPDGYELIDLRVTEVSAGADARALRDASTIYQPKALDFSELRLTSLGGTINLDTRFEPPAPATTLEERPLYPAPTVERWVQRTVLGRDYKVEVVYAGYLFPFGNRAALVKVTERKYTTPDRDTGRGPTAYLVQRMFIRVAQPEKITWFDQPDGGRGWPCARLSLLTRETPDIVDPTEPVEVDPQSRRAVTTPNGRLIFGPGERGLVFWPRTAPFATATTPFEFQVDGAPDRLTMPLIFVDSEAARRQETLWRLVDHYNGIRAVDPKNFEAPPIESSPRVMRHAGTLRPYATELSEGDSSYETLAWVVGAEGRPGNLNTEIDPLIDPESVVGKDVREQRKARLGPRENHYFGPLLTADDQPPFYPFVQFAQLRLDRLARLTGQRHKQVCLTAFDGDYLTVGLPDPSDPTAPEEPATDSGVEAIFGVLNELRFDVGSKGDRVGAIGRPAGHLTVLARKEGPVLTREPCALREPFAPPFFGDLIATGCKPPTEDAALTIPGLGRVDDFRPVQSSLSDVLDMIMGDSDFRLLGVFKITEILSSLATLAESVPMVRETFEYAEGGLQAMLDFIRTDVLGPLADAAEAVEETYDSAALQLGGEKLELRQVYPEVYSAVVRLKVATAELAAEENTARAAALVGGLPAAGKALIAALDNVSRDPISPLKREIRRLIVGNAEVERIVAAYSAIQQLQGALETGAVEAIEVAIVPELEVQIALLEARAVAELRRMLPAPAVIEGTSGDFADQIEAAVAEILTDFAAAASRDILAGKTRLRDVVLAAQAFDATAALVTAVESSTELEALVEDLTQAAGGYESGLARALLTLDAEARPYVETLLDLYVRIVVLKTEGQRLRQAIRDTDITLPGSDVLAEGRRLILMKIMNQESEIGEAVALSLLGVSPAVVRARTERIRTALMAFIATVESGSDLDKLLPRGVELFSAIDEAVLSSSFAADMATAAGALESASAEVQSEFLAPILDAYRTVLAMTASIAGRTLPAERIDSAAYLAQVDGLLGDLRAASQAPLTAEAELDAALNDIDLEMEKGRAGLRRQIGYSPLRMLVAGGTFGEGRAAVQVPGIVGLERNYINALAATDLAIDTEFLAFGARITALREPVVMLFADVASAQARANRAYQDYADASSAAIDAVDAFETTPSRSAFETLVETFPKTEMLALLSAWPALMQETLAALQRAEEAYRKSLGSLFATDIRTLFARVEEAMEAASTGAERDRLLTLAASIADLAGWAEAMLAQAAGSVLDSLAEEIATLPNVAADAEDVIAEARRQALDYAQHFLAAANQAATAVPILAPARNEIGLLVADLERQPDPLNLRNAQAAIEAALAEFVEKGSLEDATSIGSFLDDRLAAADALKQALRLETQKPLIERLDIGEAVASATERAGTRMREAALAEAAHALAALQTSLEAQARGALDWLTAQAFSGNVGVLLDVLATIADRRDEVLMNLAGLGDDLETINSIIGGLDLLPQGPDRPPNVLHMLVAVPDPSAPFATAYDLKGVYLEALKTGPIQDVLRVEAENLAVLNAVGSGSARTDAARYFIGQWGSGQFAAIQIVTFIEQTLSRITRADLSVLVDFRDVGREIERQIRKIIPTRLRTQMSFDAPIKGFAGIFEPTPASSGRLTVTSTNIIDLGGVLDGEGPTLEASAEAVLSPFSIRLLGGFEAITLYFSQARMTWQLGSEPEFSIEFLDFEIGRELEFVQNVAQSLTASSGGAYIRPATGVLGIEAGYRLNVAAINLGGITFMNVGLSALAILPFENRAALFGAALSSRSDPFVIIAGIWGGGGHFSLASDGRKITNFDASFVFGGGGAIAYGPLTLQGRVSVGVFVRKAGSYTEISGDFFAGGSGRVAIFGVSSSFLVTMGMDGSGSMTGSAVFSFSFSVGIASVDFSVTVWKQEGKGFASAGAEQRDARLVRARRYAQDGPPGPPAPTARIRVNTERQDQDYRVWHSYFSPLRSRSYINGT